MTYAKDLPHTFEALQKDQCRPDLHLIPRGLGFKSRLTLTNSRRRRQRQKAQSSFSVCTHHQHPAEPPSAVLLDLRIL